MNEILLPYGMRNGSLVHISKPEILSGITDCTCPECGETLIARKGEFNQHHFAHKGEAGRPLNARCLGGFETAAHIRAKEIIAAAGVVRFPDKSIVKLDSVLLEKTLDPSALRPDITVRIGERTAVIEIFITSRCSPTKVDILRSHRIPSMEIVLQGWRRAVNDDAAFQQAVLYTASRVWIYDPSEKDRRSTQMVLDDARREAAARAEFLASLPAVHAARETKSGSQPSAAQSSLLVDEVVQRKPRAEPEAHIKQSDFKFLSPEEREAWIESVMAPVRRRYSDVIQPQILGAAEARRKANAR